MNLPVNDLPLYKTWSSLRASICARGQTVALIPAGPVPRHVALMAGGLFTALGGVMHYVFGPAPAFVFLAFLMGLATAGAGRMLWRFRSPTLVMDRARSIMYFPRIDNHCLFSDIASFECFSTRDVRGHAQVELVVVLTGEDSSSCVSVLVRNNFDHDPFRFYRDHPATEIRELAGQLARIAGVSVHCVERDEKRIDQGIP